MNDNDFILLIEKYLDGSISKEERASLCREVQERPDRQQLFTDQTRQHVRIHAQTSQVDFSESQRIAVMAIDIAEKHRSPNTFLEVLRPRTVRERLVIMLRGLRTGKDSPAYQAAKDELFRLFGPTMISVAINVAVILLIFCWVPYVMPPPPRSEGITITVSDGRPIPESPLDPIVPTEAPPSISERVTPILLAGVRHETDPGPVGGDIAATPPPTADFRDSDSNQGSLFTPPVSTTPIKFQAVDALSCRDVKAREVMIRKTDGASASESAVGRALQWLKTHQSADGSWPGQDTTAMTGLALLAYLAHGEMPSNPEFGDTVTRALKFLLARQDSKGVFSRNVYAHAIATYAVAEAFTMTRILELRLPLEKAIRIILEGQQTRGGFDYNYKKDLRFDTSVTGWQIQALKSAKLAGLEMPGLEQSLSQAAQFLKIDAFARDGGGFVYDGKAGTTSLGGATPSMTGVGTLCLQMLGHHDAPQTRAGLRALKEVRLEWPSDGKAKIYGSYYITQAKFQSGNKSDWANWNRQMQQTIVSRQAADGHWENGDYDSGSNVYTTTLCTLMLEVYYRYLPSYAKGPGTNKTDRATTGDVTVDVR